MYAWIKSSSYMTSIIFTFLNLCISFALYFIEKNEAFYLNVMVFLWNLGIGMVLFFAKKNRSERLLILSMFQLWFAGVYCFSIFLLYWWNDNNLAITFGEKEKITYGCNLIGLLLHAVLLYLAAKVLKRKERRHHHYVAPPTERTVVYRAGASEGI